MKIVSPRPVTVLADADLFAGIEAERQRLASATGLPVPSLSAAACALIRRGLAATAAGER